MTAVGIEAISTFCGVLDHAGYVSNYEGANEFNRLAVDFLQA